MILNFWMFSVLLFLFDIIIRSVVYEGSSVIESGTQHSAAHGPSTSKASIFFLLMHIDPINFEKYLC